MRLKRKWVIVFSIIAIIGIIFLMADPESTKEFILSKLIGLALFIPSGLLLAE